MATMNDSISLASSYFIGSNSINRILGSGNPSEINDLGRFLDIHSQSTTTALTRAQESHITDEVRKQYTEIVAKASAQLVQNFLDLYMSAATDKSDINLRLGKVVGARSNLRKLPSTDDAGNVYTRSSFRTSWLVDDFVGSGPAKKQFNYSSPFFPPYQNNLPFWMTNFESYSSFAPWKKVSQKGRGTDTYNLDTFKANRLLFTYREPGFKAINDNINFLQTVFEGVTGIVSTYLTEWDLSLYIQEGILNAIPNRNGKLISLLFRMKQDNPMGYTDDRAYVFGAINAMTSKRSLEKIYDIAAYPQSAFWLKYDQTTTAQGVPDFYYNSIPSKFPGQAGIRDKLYFLDCRGAALSGWKDWTPYFWKIGYTTPEDGLSPIDAELFADEEVPVDSAVTSRRQETEEDGTDWWKKVKPSSGKEKKNAATKTANKYVTSMDMLAEKSDENAHFTIPIGVATHNPFLTGGPHGHSFSPRSVQSYFQLDSKFLPNHPRIGPVTDIDSKSPETFYTGLNSFYKFRGTEGEEREMRGQYGVSEFSPTLAFSLLKNGIQEKRGARVWTLKRTLVTVETTEGEGNGQSTYPQYRYPNWETYWAQYPYPQEMVTNPMTGQAEPQPITWVSHVRTPSVVTTSRRGRDSYDTYSQTKYTHTGYGWRWEYSVADRYLLHSRPHDDFAIKEMKGPEFESSTGWATGLWGPINSLFLQWAGAQAGVAAALRTINTRFQLVFPNSPWSHVRIFPSSAGVWPTRVYTSAELDVAENMVRNARDGQKNYLTFFGGRNPFIADCMFRAAVQMKTYPVVYHIRVPYRHGCHTDYANIPVVGFMEYIDVDMTDIPLAMCDINGPTNTNYGKYSMLEGSEPAVTRNVHSVYSYFKDMGGTTGIEGRGVLSSIAGLDPSLDKIYGNGYANLLTFSEQSKDVRFANLSYPGFTIARYNRNAYQTPEGNRAYADAGWEDYNVNTLPIRISKTLTRAFTRGSFYKTSGNKPYMVSSDAPFRLLLSQLMWQRSFLDIAKNQLIDNLDWANVNKVIRAGIDKSTVCVAGLHKSNHQDYNYYLDKALDVFGVTITQDASGKAFIGTVPSNKVQTLKLRYKEALTQKIALYDQLIKIYSAPCNKPIEQWTYRELSNCFLNLSTAEQAANSQTEFDEFFMAYLNVLYEYRKNFFNKRFNKTDGSYFMFRHLEATLTLAAMNATLEEQPSLIALDGDEIKVAMFKVDNPIVKKAQAVASGVPLAKDRVKTLYVEVEYVTMADYTRDQADMRSTGRVEPLVVQVSDGRYALKPADGTYQLLSKQYIDNENNLKFNDYLSTLSPAEQANLTRKQVYAFDKCVRPIRWGDEISKTPILFNNTAGIDTEKLMEYKRTTAKLDQNTQDALCYARKAVDYWTIEIPSGERPGAVGYITNLKLVPYNENGNGTGRTLEMAVTGFMSNTLYPITEKQAKLAPGQAEALDGVYTAMLSNIVGGSYDE